MQKGRQMNFKKKVLTVIVIAGTMVSDGVAQEANLNLTGDKGQYQVTGNIHVQDSKENNTQYQPKVQNSQQLPTGSITVETKTRANLVQLMLSASSRHDGDVTTFPIGLELTYGQLFSKSNPDFYDGFYRVTGKIDSDSTIRLNATSGYYLPVTGGEVLLSYRLLNSNLRESLNLTGAFEEKASEQGFSLNYSRYINSFIRSIGVNVSYTNLDGDISSQTVESDIDGIWSLADISTGFGNVETGAVTIQTAIGSEDWDNPFLKGFRLDLDAGYEEVQYGAFGNIAEDTDQGLTVSATATISTTFGQALIGYHSGEASSISSISLGSSALKLYFRDIDYQTGNRETIYGLNLAGNLDDLLNPSRYFASLFSSQEKLFPKNKSGYSNIADTGHDLKFANDQFIAKPQIHEIRKNIFVVDQNSLPPNVHLNKSRQVLTVFSQSSLTKIISTHPDSASSAFSLKNGQLEIALSNLPLKTQIITTKAREIDGGETWVSIKTSVGSLHVDSVSVQENQNIKVQPPESDTPESDPEVQTHDDSGDTGGDTGEPPAENQAPTADLLMESIGWGAIGEPGAHARLWGGRSSDPEDGTSISYSWSVVGDCTIGPAAGKGEEWAYVQTTFLDGYHCVASLKVCDTEGLCDTDSYTIPQVAH